MLTYRAKWKYTDCDSRQRHPAKRDSLTCSTKQQAYASDLQQRSFTGRPRESEDDSVILDEQSDASSPCVSSHTPSTPKSRGMSKRLSPFSLDSQSKRPRQDADLQDYVHNLVHVAKDGLKRLEKKLTQPMDLLDVHGLISRLHILDRCDSQRDELMWQLEAKFRCREAGDRGQNNAIVWKNWYYSACLRVILHRRGHAKRTRTANGAFILNQIVNSLLVTNGVGALVLFAAYAGIASPRHVRTKIDVAQRETFAQAGCPTPSRNWIKPGSAKWLQTSFEMMCSSLAPSVPFQSPRS